MFLLCQCDLTHRNQFDILSCATGPAQSGILFDREVVNLFLHFTVNPKPRVDYIDRPRCCLRGEECSINRFQQVESRWGYSGTSDRIRWDHQHHRWRVIDRSEQSGFILILVFSLGLSVPLKIQCQQKNIYSGIWPVWFNTWTHWLPGQHTGTFRVRVSLIYSYAYHICMLMSVNTSVTIPVSIITKLW